LVGADPLAVDEYTTNEPGGFPAVAGFGSCVVVVVYAVLTDESHVPCGFTPGPLVTMFTEPVGNVTAYPSPPRMPM
jgi:hypothetical protein